MIPIAVFVKTPGLSPIKTRLANEIGKEKAESFYQVCCRWTQSAIDVAVKQCALHPLWAVAEVEGTKSPLWEAYENIYQGEGNLGERLHFVHEQLIRRFGTAIVIGADSPEIDPNVIVSAANCLREEAQSCFVLGNTPDGGFYLFASNRGLSKEVWTSISYSENTTAQQLRNAISSFGRVVELPPCADVDYLEDLRNVMTRLKISQPQKYSELLGLQLI